MNSHSRRFWVAVLFAGACLSLLASPALGISNGDRTLTWAGGSGGGTCWNGTHGWIAANAAHMAAQHGAGWVNTGIAVDRSVWPDTRFGDHRDHNYNRWGSYPSPYNRHWGTRFGNPQKKVQHYYNLTVAALRRGNKSAASANFGIMSHYFADISQPMHTEESRSEGNANHGAYERKVDRLFRSTSSHRDWLRWDGNTYVRSASAFTVAAAIKSHSHYWDLVNNFAHNGYNSRVGSITRTQLNSAVNGLADLIYSAQYDADSVSAVIDAASPSGVTTGEPVAFRGHGVDTRHRIVAWEWTSSINGLLSRSAAFTTSGLSVGTHKIYFRVESAAGKWSAQKSVTIVVRADDVNAIIDSVSPSSVASGQPVVFSGHGTDSRHAIVAWEWTSSIDGLLSQTATFTTSSLSAGNHTIYFRVECARGRWSVPESTQVEVTPTP